MSSTSPPIKPLLWKRSNLDRARCAELRSAFTYVELARFSRSRLARSRGAEQVREHYWTPVTFAGSVRIMSAWFDQFASEVQVSTVMI